MTQSSKCPFCSEEIDSSLEICPICSELLPKNDKKTESVILPSDKLTEENKKSDKLTEENKKKVDLYMKIANQIKNHLEFLGYFIDEIINNQTNDNLSVSFSSKHEKKSNIIININTDKIILVRAQYSWINDGTEEEKFILYENLNKANTRALLTRWYYSPYTDWPWIINVEFLIREYEKSWFWRDIEIMEDEISVFLQLFS